MGLRPSIADRRPPFEGGYVGGSKTENFEILGRLVCLDAISGVSVEYIANPSDTSAWHPQASAVLTLMVEAGVLRGLNEDFTEARMKDGDVEFKLGKVRSLVDGENPGHNTFRGGATVARRREARIVAIPSSIRRQRNFVAGQVSPDAERRSDLDIFDAGLKRARNVRALDTGALGRRPGRKVLYFDGGQHDLVRPISPTIFDVTFDAGRFTARLQNGGVVSNITGCPWTAAILPTISWQAVGKRIFVTARGMQPQYLEYDDATGVCLSTPSRSAPALLGG